MIRYRITKGYTANGTAVTPSDHPDYGFDTATDAVQYADERNLDWRWFCDAYEVTDASRDAQPVRLGGIP